MSKSADSAYNYIALTDTPDKIRRKIKRAVTDSGAEVRIGPDKPALTNLLTIYSLLSGESVEAARRALRRPRLRRLQERPRRGRGRGRWPRSSGAWPSWPPTRASPSTCCATAPSAPTAIAERTMRSVRDRMGFVPRP